PSAWSSWGHWPTGSTATTTGTWRTPSTVVTGPIGWRHGGTWTPRRRVRPPRRWEIWKSSWDGRGLPTARRPPRSGPRKKDRPRCGYPRTTPRFGRRTRTWPPGGATPSPTPSRRAGRPGWAPGTSRETVPTCAAPSHHHDRGPSGRAAPGAAAAAPAVPHQLRGGGHQVGDPGRAGARGRRRARGVRRVTGPRL